jgi:hypothetical protein
VDQPDKNAKEIGMAIEKLKIDTGIFVDHRIKYSGSDMSLGMKQFAERWNNRDARWMAHLDGLERRLLRIHTLVCEARRKQFGAAREIREPKNAIRKIAQLGTVLDDELTKILKLGELVPPKHRKTVLENLRHDFARATGSMRQLRDAFARKDIISVSRYAVELGEACTKIQVRPYEPSARMGQQTSGAGQRTVKLRFGNEEERVARDSEIRTTWVKLFNDLTRRDSVSPKRRTVDDLVAAQFDVGYKSIQRARRRAEEQSP